MTNWTMDKIEREADTAYISTERGFEETLEEW
jgi:hypothetical protein